MKNMDYLIAQIDCLIDKSSDMTEIHLLEGLRAHAVAIYPRVRTNEDNAGFAICTELENELLHA